MRILSFLLGVLLFFSSCQTKPKSNPTQTPNFQTQVLDDQIQIGYGLAIGDVDGDQKPDILLADKKQFVWYRNGDWQRFVMAENLTEKDNVCIATRDINGDGKVEVAVGAQWNPGETSDSTQSGAVFYLIRPEDPTQKWEAVALPHEPTVHRMQWLKTGKEYQLVVLPLHGRGNKNGEGEAVKMYAYKMPENPKDQWSLKLLDESMHLTHNFDIISEKGKETLLVGGKEGAKSVAYSDIGDAIAVRSEMQIEDHGFGEIRWRDGFTYGIQPLHGHELVVYPPNGERKVLTDSLKQGHALAIANVLGSDPEQIVVGWRNENEQGNLGIKLFIPKDKSWNSWQSFWIDQNGMACEDLKLADLNGDGKLDIIAAGRSTKNLKIYWNRN